MTRIRPASHRVLALPTTLAVASLVATLWLGSEAGHLARAGRQVAGLDLSGAALARVLRPRGKLLLRASLRTAGVRNDIDEEVIRATFGGWQIERMQQAAMPSDTRLLDVLVVRLTTPA